MTDAPTPLQQLIGRVVVLDMSGMYVYIGRLLQSDIEYLLLENADVHDLRDSHTSRERYILDSKQHGVRSNRARVLVRRNDVISISALDDVME